ncbi:siphovirus Gp157 family protein [Peptacetobacter hiranonis]|uniref:siphovirus Gp157 family protein n=1 Tax=Peptacetobacter hiranonis TaxID=89152 RepID=UPI002E77A03D|nr:siphovirus Gp157 family protein [Peptacetobacter hiranonis]
MNARDEKQIENLKKYTKECIEALGKKRIETVLGNLTVRKAQPVVKVLDATKLPEEYLIRKTTTNADKVKIKEHFKDTGEILDGIEIVLETSLTVPRAKKGDE